MLAYSGKCWHIVVIVYNSKIIASEEHWAYVCRLVDLSGSLQKQLGHLDASAMGQVEAGIGMPKDSNIP